MPSVRAKERERVTRVDRGEHHGVIHEPDHAKDGDHQEPADHDWTEESADAVSAVPLNREDPDEDGHRDRHDVGLEQGRGDLEPFDRAEHRDGRRDHAVAVEQRRAEDAQQDEQRPAWSTSGSGRKQCGQRQDAAFALVVRPHHDGDVLDGDDEEQRIDDQRQHAEDVLVGGRDGMRPEEAFPHRIERAGADVAVNDADRASVKGRSFRWVVPRGARRPPIPPTGLADGLEVGSPLPELKLRIRPTSWVPRDADSAS